MTKFEAIKFTNDGWIWRVTSGNKTADVLVEFENASEKLLKLIELGADPNDVLVSKCIAWSKFKKMALA